MDERWMFDRFHEALDMPLRPGAFERLQTALVRSPVMPVRKPWFILRLPRLSQRVASAVLLVVFAMAAVGVFLIIHRTSTVPISPRHHSGVVIFPSQMNSPTTGWALVASADQNKPSELWRTTDGANSWSQVSPPSLPDRQHLYSDGTYFLDGTHAWVGEAGGPNSPGDHFVTFRTVDGGRTWQQGAPVSTGQLSAWPGGAQLDFIDADHGWLLLWKVGPPSGWPALFGTHDGGLHWNLTTLSAGDIPVGGLVPGGGYIAFSSSATGWLMISLYQADSTWTLSREILLVTHDGGVSWQLKQLPFTASQDSAFLPPIFFGGQHGIIVIEGSAPALLVSPDGGTNWVAESVPWETAWAVDFVDANHGWAVAGLTSQFAKTSSDSSAPATALPLYRTSDGGASWTGVQTNLRFYTTAGRLWDFFFVDQTTAFADRLGSEGPTELLETTDGGRTWTLVEVCKSLAGLGVPPPACANPPGT